MRFLLYALREYKTGERKQWGAWLLTLVSYNCRVSQDAARLQVTAPRFAIAMSAPPALPASGAIFPGAKLLFRRHSVALPNNSVER